MKKTKNEGRILYPGITLSSGGMILKSAQTSVNKSVKKEFASKVIPDKRSTKKITPQLP